MKTTATTPARRAQSSCTKKAARSEKIRYELRFPPPIAAYALSSSGTIEKKDGGAHKKSSMWTRDETITGFMTELVGDLTWRIRNLLKNNKLRQDLMTTEERSRRQKQGLTRTPLIQPNFTTPLDSAASLAAASSAGVSSSPLANPSSNGSWKAQQIYC